MPQWSCARKTLSHDVHGTIDSFGSLGSNRCLPKIFRERVARDLGYFLENSHNPFIFKGRVAAIFTVLLWFAEPMIYSYLSATMGSTRMARRAGR
jgi:hypothetical protein